MTHGRMIRGIHGLFYSSDPETARTFIRDKLGLPYTDVGEGWLIFDFPEGDLGIHPVDTKDSATAGTHDISFYCDDIHDTVAALEKRGVVFDEPISEAGFGHITYFRIPGGVKVMLYEPKYVKRQIARRTCTIPRKGIGSRKERRAPPSKAQRRR